MSSIDGNLSRLLEEVGSQPDAETTVTSLSDEARGKKLVTTCSASAYYTSVTGTKARPWAGHTTLADESCTLEFQRRQRGSQKRQPNVDRTKELQQGTSEDKRGIGYKLLRKAGWKGLGGLGAQEQGITSPISAWIQAGREGIGVSHPPADLRDKQAVTAARDSEHGNAEPAQQRNLASIKDSGGRPRAPKREWERVEVVEPVDSKVKRWRQVMQAEADDKAGKALDRYIFREFRDDSSLDTNPLMRKNNLTRSNPLL